jgi:Tol biopolymer transport system component
LQFLVSQNLKNDAERMKEYVIAVEVFGRDESFDPRIDSLVRVEANRLRARLKLYYDGPGSTDRVRIDVPAGSYVPVYEIHSQPEPTAPPEPPVVAPPPRGGRNYGIALGMVAILLIAWSGSGSPRDTNRRLVRLTRVTSGEGLSAYPAISADGSWMVFSSDRNGGRLHLWKKPIDGDAKQLTTGNCNDIDADISDDGRWIAYHSDCNGGELLLIPSAGGAPRLIGRFGHSPRFNPGGTYLTYWVRNSRTGFGMVYTARLDAPEEPQHVAREFDDAHNPVWTADGRGILICGTRRSRRGPAEEHDFWIVSVDGKPPIKTGAFERLGKTAANFHSDVLPATSFRWIGEREVLFAVHAAGNSAFHRIAFDSSWRIVSDSRMSTEAVDQPLHPFRSGGKAALATARASVGIWGLGLSPNDGRVTGGLRRLTGSREAVSPALSPDGRMLVFSSPEGRRRFILCKLDMDSGKVSELATFAGSSNRLKISPDGKTVYLRLIEGSGVQKQPIYAVDVGSGAVKKICVDCGPPTHVTPDGKLVIYEAPNTSARLSAVRVETGERWEFLEHPHHAVTAGRVSPDGNWIAFHADRGLDGRQVYAAPFRSAAPVAVRTWIQITSPDQLSWDPWWSPNGNYLYFLSQRDGARCVWAQRVDSGSKRPVGEPIVIHHFHNPGLNPLTFSGLAPLYIGLTVARDQLVLSLSETRSDVWAGEIEPIR